MDLQPKQACVLFRTIVEAAKEMDKEEALELLLTYADYALGDTEDIETDNKYIKLILKQLVPALSAAERRYEAAVENGKKGKNSGKKGGRPRKNETKEEAYARRNGSEGEVNIVGYVQENPSKTPEQSPVNSYEKTPVKPLDVDVEEEVDAEVEEEKEVYTEISKDKEIYEDFCNKLKKLCLSFIYKHSDYNYLLDTNSFKNHYYDNVCKFQMFVNECLKTNLSIDDYCMLLIENAKEEINI